MTATNLTASISGTIYPVLNTTYGLDDKVDERSTVRLTIFDANASYQFQFGQPVVISDTLEGVKFTGFVAKPVSTKYNANAALAWQLDCVDNEFLAGKKTTNRIINQQYAGVAAASMVNDHLSQDGIVANYAIRDDNTQAEFAQGTLSGTAATSNLGGDLELAPAGSATTITESTTSVFNSGTLTNMTASGNALGPSSTTAMMIQATQSIAGIANSYTYVKFWAGTPISIVSGRYLEYDIWISSSSPEAKIGIDLVFSDGTAYRDLALSNNGLWFDAQNKSPHPGTDLKGLATDQWYHRKFLLDNFTSKTITYAMIAIEGDSGGTYTGYVKNVYETNGSGTIINTFYGGGSTNVNPPQQMQKQGYGITTVSTVGTYDCSTAQRVSPAYSISNTNILKSSFLTYQVGQSSGNPGLPTGYSFNLSYSIDGGNSYTSITSNNAALPNLLAGQSLSGKSIQFLQSFTQSAGADPTQQPRLTYMQALLYPSYNASKSDINIEYTTNAQWNTGTFTNAQVNGGVVSPFGATRNWDDGNISGQTLYGGGATGPSTATTCYQYVDSKQFRLQLHQSTEARSRMDIAGGSWGDFQMEFDVSVDNPNMKVGCVYRTTGWSNYDGTFAYGVEIAGTTVKLFKGSNNGGASSNFAVTQVGSTATVNLTSQAMHRVKLNISGSTHNIYLDDVLVINATDSTYTSAGYVGLRISNNDSSNGYIGTFDNWGISPPNIVAGANWTSSSTSLASAGTYGGSVVQWTDLSGAPFVSYANVWSSIDGGSSWQYAAPGGPIPNLTLGQSLSGVSVKFQVLFSSASSTMLPQGKWLTVYVLGGFSSSGTRIAPFLPLSNALIAGSTVASWTATTPANTSITVATSLDGVTYTNVSNGGSIAGITTQPSPTLDTFDINSSPNYTQTNRTGGSAGTWFWDTLNSRLSVSGGTNALLLLSSIPTCKDVDIILDFDQSDQSGPVWRQTDASNFYELDIFDASSSAGATNKIRLYKVVANVKTQLGSDVAVTLTRGYKYRLHLSMIGTAINVWIDGVNLISTTDSSISAAGLVGIIEATGVGRFYNFRVQPQGDNLSGKVVYSKVTLTSTDPTATPQLTDLTVAALHPNIGLGALIPTADYTNTYISDNINDLAKKSDYTWFFDQNLNFVFGPRVAQPAPWILQSSDQLLLLDGPLTVDYSADLYRNEMILTGVVATGIKSETKIGDGTSTSWALGGEIVSPPLVYLNAQFKTIGIKGIDTGKDFYYTPGSNAIDQDPSGTVLQQTDTLLFQNYTYQYITSITVDNTNLANTVTQKQFAQRMGRTQAIQNVLNGTSAAHTTSSNFGDLDVGKCRRIAVDINITAVSGTSPTIQFFVERKDVNGIYYQLWSSNAVSAANPISTTIGAFATINQALGATVRLRWTITGTSPSFTFSASITGILDVQSAGLGIVAVVEDVSSQSLNVAAATAYANGLLQKYGTQGRTITFKTWRRNPSLAIGQYLPIFLPEYNINDASMLITGISTSQSIGTENGTPTQIYWQTVVCSEAANIGSAWRLLSSTLK